MDTPEDVGWWIELEVSYEYEVDWGEGERR